MTELDKIKELLKKDLLIHVSHLKMLEQYEASIKYELIEQDNNWGILLLLPVSSSSFDTEMYPDAGYVVYFAGSEDEMVPFLMKKLPGNTDLVFKIHKPNYKNLLETKYQLTWRRSYLYYSCSEQPHVAHDDHPMVIKSTYLDERLIPLWEQNGYVRSEIETYFEMGASSFSMFINNKPISTCLIFHNCDQIWEVGAVHTIERERGNGYAKRVVRAALKEILNNGNIPKYQVEYSNLPSIKLAEALGMKLFFELKHYYYKANKI